MLPPPPLKDFYHCDLLYMRELLVLMAKFYGYRLYNQIAGSSLNQWYSFFAVYFMLFCGLRSVRTAESLFLTRLF